MATKKLSNKERRALAKEKARAEADKSILSDVNDLSQFTLSAAANSQQNIERATDIKVDNFTISTKDKVLFEDAQLTIAYGRRYGLVGPNGMGKTTLLRHIANRHVAIPPNIDVLYCEQEVQIDDSPAIEVVLRSDKKVYSLYEKERQLLQEMDELNTAAEAGDEAAAKELDKRDAALSAVYEEMAVIGADGSEARARRILSGLGFTAEMQQRKTRHFSGGWRMRISLARALFLEPTLLLLDEPTNHLDLNAVIWLDSYLQQWKKTLLVVSHDQDFLDNVCTDMMHLDEKKLFYYKGNYSAFKSMHQQRLREKEKAFHQQAKAIKAAMKTGTKMKELPKPKGRDRNKNEKALDLVKMAKTDRKKLLKKPREYTVNFQFHSPPVQPAENLGLHDVSFQYPTGPVIFDNINFGFNMSSRVAIVGPNGVGKSTFLNLLTGVLQPTSGTVPRHRLRISHYHQHAADQLPYRKSPRDFLMEKFNMDEQDVRRLLGRFGLDSKGHLLRMKDLSGGQKARVVFALICLEKPDLLILDEPTNNLDLESIDALCEAINEYTGGVVLVSHDARVILETECDLFVCGNQTIERFDGDFDDYRESIIDELEEEERAKEAAQKERAAVRMADKEARLAEAKRRIKEREDRAAADAAIEAELAKKAEREAARRAAQADQDAGDAAGNGGDDDGDDDGDDGGDGEEDEDEGAIDE